MDLPSQLTVRDASFHNFTSCVFSGIPIQRSNFCGLKFDYKYGNDRYIIFP